MTKGGWAQLSTSGYHVWSCHHGFYVLTLGPTSGTASSTVPHLWHCSGHRAGTTAGITVTVSATEVLVSYHCVVQAWCWALHENMTDLHLILSPILDVPLSSILHREGDWSFEVKQADESHSALGETVDHWPRSAWSRNSRSSVHTLPDFLMFGNWLLASRPRAGYALETVQSKALSSQAQPWESISVKTRGEKAVGRFPASSKSPGNNSWAWTIVGNIWLLGLSPSLGFEKHRLAVKHNMKVRPVSQSFLSCEDGLEDVLGAWERCGGGADAGGGGWERRNTLSICDSATSATASVNTIFRKPWNFYDYFTSDGSGLGGSVTSLSAYWTMTIPGPGRRRIVASVWSSP